MIKQDDINKLEELKNSLDVEEEVKVETKEIDIEKVIRKEMDIFESRIYKGLSRIIFDFKDGALGNLNRIQAGQREMNKNIDTLLNMAKEADTDDSNEFQIGDVIKELEQEGYVIKDKNEEINKKIEMLKTMGYEIRKEI